MTPARQHQPDPQRTVQGILPGDSITAYQAITDVETTARYSEEVITAAWVTRANAHGASVGDMFIAHNRISDRTWTSTSTVVAADPGHRFAFAVGGPANPVAVWTFDLTPAPPTPSDPNTKVSYTVTFGATYSHRAGQHADPQRRASDIRRRLDSLARNMDLFLEAVAADLQRTLGRTDHHPHANCEVPRAAQCAGRQDRLVSASAISFNITSAHSPGMPHGSPLLAR